MMHRWWLNLQPMCSVCYKESRLCAAALAAVSFLQLLS